MAGARYKWAKRERIVSDWLILFITMMRARRRMQRAIW